MMAFNPYATDESLVEDSTPQYVMPSRATFEAPSLAAGDAYIDELGWSPKLKTSATDVPSGQRLGTIPRYDTYPDPKLPAEQHYLRQDRDERQRHGVEDINAVPYTVSPGIGPNDRRWAPNPRSTPPAESRVTSRLSPHSYSMTRPFDQHAARRLNGDHFSMADHRREYEVTGMAPVRTMRNTYRLEPTPWDTDVVDLPPDDNFQPNGRIRSVEIPLGNRSGRLM